MVTSKRLMAILCLIGLALSGCAANPPRCNGDFSKLMPKDWTFVSQTPLDTDGKGQLQCIVLYRFEAKREGQKVTPVGGVVYREDHGRPRWVYPHPLRLPEDLYLGENKVTARVADVLSGSEGPELIIEDTNPEGNVIQVSIFSWRDGKRDNPDVDPFSNPDAISYKALGLFLGDGVTVEKDKVAVLKRRPGTRSQLADRMLYLARENKNYFEQGSTALIKPAETNVISLAPSDDATTSRYPEKAVLAFYDNVNNDAKLEGLMPPDVLGSFKAGKLPYGCPVGRDQVERVLVQNLEWTPDINTQPQKITVTGQCMVKGGQPVPLGPIAWLLKKNVEDRWQLEGTSQ